MPERRARPDDVARVRTLLRDAEVLLVVPPFANLGNPCLGVHLLQACGRQAGFRVQVLYANLFLAARIGEDAYTRICNAPLGSFAGERFFARTAFGGQPLGRRAHRMFEPDWVIAGEEDAEFEASLEPVLPLTLRELKRLEKHAAGMVKALARAIAAHGYPLVGCTTTFEQTAASLALLNRVKALRPQTVTLLGGANCEGEMARGIASLGAKVDHIFSGESEDTFPRFVSAVLAGARPAPTIITGEPNRNLDALPAPHYREFYGQRAALLPENRLAAAETELIYETSRGCWWGEKHHCTFCGMNGETMALRQKSPDRIVHDLRALLAAHPTRRVLMADNIMPRGYFKSLLPRLAAELPGISLFYEQKANLTLENFLILKQAGVTRIQPGIEALSSSLLQRMRKGVQARQNLALLRYARSTNVALEWNLLWGFPGDDIEVYKETLALLPLLHHLPPPAGLLHLSIDRFSPYFARAAEFSVRRLRPLPGYADFLPRHADVRRLAYHFQGDYTSDAHRHARVIACLAREVGRWQEAWSAGEPAEELTLSRRGDEYLLEDTRAVANKCAVRRLSTTEAASLVTPRPCAGREDEAWALREKLAVHVDDWFVPLAVAAPELLLELTARFASASQPRRNSLLVLSSTTA